MDYTEKYELDVKAGNRLGRRLRTLGSSIGKRIRSAGGAVEAYDPNAFDGDGDGLIQDASPWERPAVAVAQIAPSAITAQAESPNVRDEARSVAPSDDRKRRRESLRSSGDEAPPREGTPDDVAPDEQGTQDDATPTQPQVDDQAATGALAESRDRAKELKEKDHSKRGSTLDMSPEELADLAVRPPSDESDEHAMNSIVGNLDDYADAPDPQQAYDTAKRVVANVLKRLMNVRGGYEAVKKTYDEKHGTGAFDEDTHRDRERLADRMKELIGDAVVHSLLLGTPDTNGQHESTFVPSGSTSPLTPDITPLNAVSQKRFIEEMLNDPNIPAWKREIYTAILGTKRQSQLFTTIDSSGIIHLPTLNFIPAFFSNILAPNVIANNRQSSGFVAYHMVRGEEHELNAVVQRSWNSQGMTAKDIMVMVANDYYDWTEKQDVMVARGITRDGTDGNLPSREQVQARYDIAAGQTIVQQALPFVFPGETYYEPRIDRMLPDRILRDDSTEHPTTLGHVENLIGNQKPHTSDPQTLELARVAVAEMLRRNPQVLALWREFGVPTIRIIHPISSGDYMDLPNDVKVTPALITDRSKNGKRRILEVFSKLRNAKIYINASNAIEKAEKRQGRSRKTPKILEKFFGVRANEALSRSLARKFPINDANVAFTNIYDRANDPTMLFGTTLMEGVGGSYFQGTGMLEIDIMSLVTGILAPVKAEDGIVDTSPGYSSMEGMGSGATFFHEWVHWYNELAKGEALRILERRIAEMEKNLILTGKTPGQARQMARQHFEDLHKEYGISPGPTASWSGFWNYFNPPDASGTKWHLNDTEHPRHRKIIDFDDYASRGYATKEEMEDDFLEALLKLHKSGYEPGGLLAKLHKETGAGFSGKALVDERRRVAEAAKTSDEPFVRTTYGQTLPTERIAEGAVGAFLSQFRNLPFMNNDAMIRLLNTFFMRRDANGPLEEKHGITIFRRRKRNKARGVSWRNEYLDETESMEATSTIRTILPEDRRGPDGLRSASRSRGRVSNVQSRSMRFDPDERSRLRSGPSNIGLESDERLYAFETPITVSDFRARARTLAIGDYHFYDDGVPYSQALTPRYRAERGFLAGRVYVNRSSPHDGDMMRAMSATQFGMFVDDMPVYATTTESDRGMLRGLVTGQIADLPQSSRARIERALKNVTHIHSAVQSATPNKNDLYRVVKMDPRSFVEGLIVGERIPMPITAFARTRPSVDAGDVVIRIQRGAKAIDVQDGQFLTQGTFEVVALDRVDGQVTATLKHVETYDPRHDAMRPVDRFSDKPGAMRKFGSPRPRYTQQEQRLMEADLSRRMDGAQISKQISGLRSSGSSGYGSDVDDEIDKLIGDMSERSKSAENIVTALRAKVRERLQNQVDRRLDKARESLREMYGDSKPWREDAETINKFVSSDPARRQEVLSSIFERMKERVKDTAIMGGRTDAVQWVPNSSIDERERAAEDFFRFRGSLTARQLDILIARGEMEVALPNFRVDPDSSISLGLVGSVTVSLTDEEREVLVGIRDFLRVGSRAYMITDDNSRTFTSGGKPLTVFPEQSVGKPKFYFSLSDPDDYAITGFDFDARKQTFRFSGEVRNDGTLGNFHRIVSVDNGVITVSHASMNMENAGGGAATIINQHSWQWWKQIPKTQVLLTSANDGYIVWPRHGFSAARDKNSEDNFSYAKETRLRKAVEFIIAATSPNQKTRESTYPPPSGLEKLIVARIDREGNARYRNPDLKDSDKRLRERLALWLALAIQDEQRDPELPRRASMVMLANLLDTSEMTDEQLKEWKGLFQDIYDGGLAIQLDSSDNNDPDYLPSFVIDDEDPTGAIVARRIAIAEERSQGGPMDMFLPMTWNTGDSYANGDSINAQEVVARVSRLSTLRDSSIRRDGTPSGNSTLETLVAREIAGGDVLPKLIDVASAPSLMRRSALAQQSVVLVGVGQGSRRRSDVPRLVKTANRFLRGTRGSRWDKEDRRFTFDPIFTTTPGEYVERFVDPNDPSVDPATNKVGLLGVTDQNAKWITGAEVTQIRNDVKNALDRLIKISGQDLLNADKFTHRGRPIYVRAKDRETGKDVFILHDGNFVKFLNEYFPEARQSDMRAIFGSFGDHITMLKGAANDVDRDKIEAQFQWLSQLITRRISRPGVQRRKQTIATLLGYDFLDETEVGETRTRIAVLNRGALTMVDEPVSLAGISSIAGMTVTPRNPRSLRSSGVATTMMLGDDGAPTLLRMGDPFDITPRRLQSRSYSRLLRQDYGINPPSTSLRSGGNTDLAKRLKAWRSGREERRYPSPLLPGYSTEEYAFELSQKVGEYNKLSNEIEDIDDIIMELENRYNELDEAGELTPELDASLTERIDAATDLKTEKEMKMKDFSDSIARDIATVNEAIGKWEREQGFVLALRKFLSEPASRDIPEDYRNRLADLLANLEEQAIPASEISIRHKLLQDVLDDEFDIRWEMSEVEESLEAFDEDAEFHTDEALEEIYRSFFDPEYESWRDNQNGLNFFTRPELSAREMEFREIIKDITREERERWSARHDDLLREEYNAQYEEALIDATPSDPSRVPRGVPLKVWRKVVASARLARSTPYEGERDNALDSAKRLLEPHRPDLADDDYVLTLRSSASGAKLPMIRGVNLRSQGLASRGAPPERPSVPRGDRFHSRLLERLSKYGVKEQDLMVDGKYGRVLFLLLSPEDPLSIDQLQNIIDNSDKEVESGYGTRYPLNKMLPEPLTEQDKEVLKEIVKETAKIAAQSGWGIQAIEGHRVKKINGPVHEEIADVLVDEVDLAMIRAMGAPTYERLASIHGAWARTVNRLNKMFGSYKATDDNVGVPFGSDLKGESGSYESFLRGGDMRIDGDFVRYYDIRGNLVMSVDIELAKDGNSKPQSPVSLMQALNRRVSFDYGDTNVNNIILQAMFEAVGVTDFSIRRENELAEPGVYARTRTDGKGLTVLRESLAEAREKAQKMEFAPTPAGRHMENIVLMELKRIESHIQMYERLGERFVHLLQESEGIKKSEVAERLQKLVNTTTRIDGVFQNGSPASEISTLSMFEIALSAFMSMRLGSRNMPRITDGHALDSGTHEIGHFVFGQAFTRHGEFMSNFWPYATMGPEFWDDFISTQIFQSESFDRMTIEEGLGLRWTREQKGLYDSLSQETQDALEDAGLVVNMQRRDSGGVAAKRSDMDRFLNDIIRSVQEDPNIDEIEKTEIIAGLRRVSLFEERTLDERMRTRLQEAIERDLTPEVLQALRLDPLNEEDPHISRMFTDTPWDRFVRIEPSDIGWQRTQASSSSLRSSGAPPNTVKRPYRGDDEEIIRLVGEGLSLTEIASRLGQNVTNVSRKIQRLRKAGRVGKVTRKIRQDDSLTINRRIAEAKRVDAYIQYHQNILNGMSRTEAIKAFLEAMNEEDFRVVTERGTRETRRLRLKQIVELLETVNAGLPELAMLGTRGPLNSESDYILINEMKIFGFSSRETARQLGLSVTTVERYRQMHYRAYREPEGPKTLRSSGATPDIRARVRDYVQSVAAVDGPAYEPLHALLSSDDNANFSNNSQIARVFRKLVDQIEETLRVDGNEYQTLIPMDDEGLEKLAEKLFRRVLKTSRTPRAVLTDDLRQGLAEFIRLRTADHRDRRSRYEAGASFLSTTARQTLRSSGSLRSVSEPSRRETPLSDTTREELGRVGRNANSARIALGNVDITVKRESDFTNEEFDDTNRLLDVYDRKLDRAQEMLENKRSELMDEQMTLEVLQDSGKASDRQYLRLNIIEEEIDELDRKEEILNRGYEASRLARLMMRQLKVNSVSPRQDQYDNKYIIIKNADGTLAGMTMWGFLGVDVTFNAPDVEWRSDATSLPPDDRITGRMMYVDFVVSFQNVPGMGSLLFQKALEDAKGQNGRKVFLETTDSSQPYWERLGFRVRRIAGSTSEYHELVGRIDEMHEATNVQEVG